MKNFKDLIVQRGRLINDAPNGVTGIQRAVEIKKDMKREKKIQMMAEAAYRGEMMADLDKSLRKM
jgi:hypothetical protein